MLVRVPAYAVAAMAITFPITMGLYVGSTMLFREYTDQYAYPAYMESLALEQGDLGAEPTEDTPRAYTVEDFETMDTFYTVGRLRDTPYTIDGKNYYELELENEESVLVRVNWDATEVVESPMRRTPVGKWMPLTQEQIDQVNCSYLDVDDHYIDMMGDFDKVMTEGEFCVSHPAYRYLGIGTFILMMALYITLSLVFRKRSIAKRNRFYQS